MHLFFASYFLNNKGCVGKVCMNGGTQDPDTCNCTCAFEYTGDVCQGKPKHTCAHMHDCKHAQAHTPRYQPHTLECSRDINAPNSAIFLDNPCFLKLVFLDH